uniref:nitric oxide reductase activation protein NorD n=1 Tax=Cupriavidus yeoncheonensis TaxID=1462994 RepID=UPI003F49ACDA
MAEAEEVITDVARYATAYAQGLWRRHRKGVATDSGTALRDIAQRLDLLVTAVFERSFPIRAAEVPAAATFLTKVLHRRAGPRIVQAVPATDGIHLWLPASIKAQSGLSALDHYRVLALQQAARANRGGAIAGLDLADELEHSVYQVLEAQAGDIELARLLPGMISKLQVARAIALHARPSFDSFPEHRRPLESLVRQMLGEDLSMEEPARLHDTVARARELAADLGDPALRGAYRGRLLYLDWWTGEMRAPVAASKVLTSIDDPMADPSGSPPRSARIARSPQVRKPKEDEDDKKAGAWMVQTSQPHEQVEDCVGMQRPTDRDTETAADEFADALSELPEARLVTMPGRPREVFLSEDPISSCAAQIEPGSVTREEMLQYPEWDYRTQGYADAAVTVHLHPATEGPQIWVDKTLADYRSLANLIQRRFELLRAQRVHLKKQLEGEDVDLDAYIDAYADLRAGLPIPQALYQTCREARRDMAIFLLVDVSGSTDGWVSTNKRIVDVAREALLLVGIALQGLAEPYAIAAFSGEGPHGVVVRQVKQFDETFGAIVARKIAGLEPEHYTRAGAALRYSTAMMMRQSVRHRLLLLLSDGKPNDIDDYEGRYGVEDMRLAVVEARLQGINAFCLTVDRQAANYLAKIFGPRQYALLPRPELLPTVLVDWMKMLLLR